MSGNFGGDDLDALEDLTSMRLLPAGSAGGNSDVLVIVFVVIAIAVIAAAIMCWAPSAKPREEEYTADAEIAQHLAELLENTRRARDWLSDIPSMRA